MKRYTVKDKGTQSNLRIFSVEIEGEPEWEWPDVWVNPIDKPRCTSCSGLLVAMSASCEHARAVARFLKRELPPEKRQGKR